MKNKALVAATIIMASFVGSVICTAPKPVKIHQKKSSVCVPGHVVRGSFEPTR